MSATGGGRGHAAGAAGQQQPPNQLTAAVNALNQMAQALLAALHQKQQQQAASAATFATAQFNKAEGEATIQPAVSLSATVFAGYLKSWLKQAMTACPVPGKLLCFLAQQHVAQAPAFASIFTRLTLSRTYWVLRGSNTQDNVEIHGVNTPPGGAVQAATQQGQHPQVTPVTVTPVTRQPCQHHQVTPVTAAPFPTRRWTILMKSSSFQLTSFTRAMMRPSQQQREQPRQTKTTTERELRNADAPNRPTMMLRASATGPHGRRTQRAATDSDSAPAQGDNHAACCTSTRMSDFVGLAWCTDTTSKNVPPAGSPLYQFESGGCRTSSQFGHMPFLLPTAKVPHQQGSTNVEPIQQQREPAEELVVVHSN